VPSKQVTINPMVQSPPDPPDDRLSPDTSDFAERLHEGDGAAFGPLYERIAPAIFAYACPRLGWRSEDAEDVVSEVWVRARTKFSDYDPERPFRPWVFGFAVRVVLEYQERLARMARGAAEKGPGSLLDATVIPEEASSVSGRVARDEELRLFVEWTRTLSEYDREILLLRGLQGRPHQEIAELLGRSDEAVRRTWSRLLEKIRGRTIPSSLEIAD
jgi:RNA polymerase sigma-70 factor (ECF subfamily)